LEELLLCVTEGVFNLQEICRNEDTVQTIKIVLTSTKLLVVVRVVDPD
jgi:hypothetical protein